MISFLVLYGFYLYQPSLFEPWLQSLRGDAAALPGAEEELRRHSSNQARRAQQQLIANAEQGVSADQISASYFGSAEALCLHAGFTASIGSSKQACLEQIDSRKRACSGYINREVAAVLQTAEQVRRYGKLYMACLMDPHFELQQREQPSLN